MLETFPHISQEQAEREKPRINVPLTESGNKAFLSEHVITSVRFICSLFKCLRSMLLNSTSKSTQVTLFNLNYQLQLRINF